MNGTVYNVQYAYDRQGNITGLMYPNGSQVAVSYNGAGLTNRIQRKPSGGSFSDVISNYDYAPHGKIQNALFGNNASTTYFYDANAVYRLSNLQTNVSGTSIQNLAYTYDAVGNIKRIMNTASTTAAATSEFGYDGLNRLIAARTSAASSSPYSKPLPTTRSATFSRVYSAAVLCLSALGASPPFRCSADVPSCRKRDHPLVLLHGACRWRK